MAIGDLTEEMRIGKRSAKAIAMIGECYEVKGLVEDARRAYEEVVEVGGVASAKARKGLKRVGAKVAMIEMELINVFNGSGKGDDQLGEIRGVFRVFDLDGDGKISAEELKWVSEVLGEWDGCGVEDCWRMIQGVDSELCI